jgi:hypothetical protein
MDDPTYSSPLEALGDYAIEFVDRCQEQYGDGYEIGEIVIVAEILRDEKPPVVEVLTSEERPYVTNAILSRAISIVQGHELAEARESAEE